MHIEAIPMRWGRGDNYAYIVTDDATKQGTIIDPAEPHEVIPVLKKRIASGLKLANLINTHHHSDHAGGNERMLREFPDCPIIGGKDCARVKITPSHNSTFNLGDIKVTALHTPCHTRDSICFLFEDDKTNEKAVFTGDTLFTAGCGRFFEGSAQDMKTSLDILANLPNSTKIYPGHEYTKSNVKFAVSVFRNDALNALENYTNANEFTTGVFTMEQEKQFNPFMRTSDPVIQKAVDATDAIDTMAALRELKNSF
jgi:hydroxyacylglutathione hydrolase